MYLLDYSLDNLSLMALTLSVGFVVDDAIVMLENIVRHVEMGERPMEAALNGSREIGFTILSMTISLAAVFLPVLFMGGLVGRLLHEFAVTIGVAILVSGFVSLSLTPMLCSRFLRPSKEGSHGSIWKLTERFFDGMLRLYDRTLQFTMRHRVATMVVSLLVLAATVQMFRVVPKGFLPDEDQGFIFVFTEGPQGISFDSMVRHQQALADVVMAQPWVDSFNSTVGGGSSSVSQASNQGRIFIHLVPSEKRRVCNGNHSRAEAEAGGDSGNQCLSPDFADDSYRRAAYQEPIPVHAAKPRCTTDVRVRAKTRDCFKD